MTRWALTLAAGLWSLSCLLGQTEFDAVSIKPYLPRGTLSEGCNSHSDPLMTGLTGCTLKQLVSLAYNLKGYQLRAKGMPWADTDRYVVQARTAAPANEARRMQMLQPVLASRFQLVVHRQVLPGPVYVLQLGSKGLKLKSASNTKQCGGVYVRTGTLKADCLTLDDLAEALQEFVVKDRPVLNRTEVEKGKQYQVSLEFSPDEDASGGPSIFSALPDQLGLVLKAGKEPVDTLVIDRARRLQAN